MSATDRDGTLLQAASLQPATAHELQSLATSLAEGGARALALFVGERFPEGVVQEFVRSQPHLPIIGGRVPAVVVGGRSSAQGFALVGLPDVLAVAVVPELSRVGDDVSRRVREVLGSAATDDGARAAFVVVDGWSSRIGASLQALYDHLGDRVTTVGAGVGIVGDPHASSVFAPGGVLRDAMVVAVVRQRLRVATAHGWRSVAGPFVANATHGTVVREIDYRPAEDVYRDVVRARGGNPDRDRPPIGVRRLDGSVLVRDVVGVSDGVLRCVGEVPSYAQLAILDGEPERLIEAAESAAVALHPSRGTALVFDCVSRVASLRERFEDELRVIEATLCGREVVGALSFGEVFGPAGAPARFLNKSVVLCAAE